MRHSLPIWRCLRLSGWMTSMGLVLTLGLMHTLAAANPTAKPDGRSAAQPLADDDKAMAPLRIHMISGSNEYRSEPSFKAYKEYLEGKYEVVVTLSLARDRGRDIPDLEPLAEADLLVVYCRRITVPDEQLAQLKAWVEAGKPVIALRTASHAFQNWLEFDKDILGGSYRGHGGTEDTTVSIIDANKDHPILEGIELPWTRVCKLYRNQNNVKETVTLLRGKGNRLDEPIAWCYVYNTDKNARSFYTSMGYPHDFENDNFKRLMLNAIHWTTQKTLREKKQED